MSKPASPFEQWWAERIVLQQGALADTVTLTRDWLAWCGKHRHMPGLGSIFIQRVREQQGIGKMADTNWLTGLKLREGQP